MLTERLGLDAGEGGVDGRLQLGGGAVAAFRQVEVLDGAEDGLDRVEFGGVRRQVVQEDVALPQVGQRLADGGAPVQTGVVEHEDQRHRGRRALAKEVDEVVGAEVAPGGAAPIEGGLRPGGNVERHGVVAPALGRLVRDALALAGANPAGVHRLAGGEAALVEVTERDPAGGRLFLSEASTRSARSTAAGSCRWRTVRWTRRQRAPIATRYLRVWRVLRAMPCSRSASA